MNSYQKQYLNTKYITDQDKLVNKISDGYDIYPDINIDILEKYYNLLKHDCDTYSENLVNYHYKPESLSNEFYGTTQFAYIIMYINNFQSMDEFIPTDKILIPKISNINKMLEEIKKQKIIKNEIELIEDDIILSFD